MIPTPNITAAFGGTFNPRSVSGLVLNYDFSDRSTLTLNGSTISEVRDKSGFGNNATQGTAAYQPTLTSNALRGRSVATFDGSNDQMSVANQSLLRNVAGATQVLVARNDLVGTTTASRGVINISTGTSNNVARCGISRDLNNDKVQFSRTRVDGTAYPASTGVEWGTNWIVIGGVVIFASALSAIFRNGLVETAYASGGTAGSTSNTDSLASVIGGRNTVTGYWGGAIAEVLVFNRAVTDAEMIYLQNGLMQKWGISA